MVIESIVFNQPLGQFTKNSGKVYITFSEELNLENYIGINQVNLSSKLPFNLRLIVKLRTEKKKL